MVHHCFSLKQTPELEKNLSLISIKNFSLLLQALSEKSTPIPGQTL